MFNICHTYRDDFHHYQLSAHRLDIIAIVRRISEAVNLKAHGDGKVTV